MSLSKITEGLSEPIKQKSVELDSDGIGNILHMLNKPTVTAPTNTYFVRYGGRKKKTEEQKELNKDTNPTE